MAIDAAFENEIFDSGIYEAWQFITYTSKTISTAEYCKDTMLQLLSSMQQEHEAWKEALWNDLISQETKVKKVSVTTNSLPSHQVTIVGENISVPFLLTN